MIQLDLEVDYSHFPKTENPAQPGNPFDGKAKRKEDSAQEGRHINIHSKRERQCDGGA